jgi:hypothetical protein
MRGFSRGGIWIDRGFYARFLGVLRSFRQHLSPCRHLFSRQKMDMNSFPVSVMGGNYIWLMIYAVMHFGGGNILSIKLPME